LGKPAFHSVQAGSPSWEEVLPCAEMQSDLKNPWLVLDLVASSAQAFAQRWKHQREKKALGLPRKIGHPASGDFRLRSGSPVGERHNSPVHYHLSLVNGSYTLCVTAFPAAELPDLIQSQQFLG